MQENNEELIKERGSDYGPWQQNMDLLGDFWLAMLKMHWQKDIPWEILSKLKLPGWMASKMMAGGKSLRACYPSFYLDDNFKDENVYNKFSEDLQSKALPPSPRNKS